VLQCGVKQRLGRRELLLGSLCALPGVQARSRIRLGCQTRAWGSPLRDRAQLLAALSDLHELGYDGFETNFASLADSFANPQPARAEFSKRGVPLIGLHMSAALFNPARLEKEQEQIAQVARAVKDLGGDYLMLSGSGAPESPEALKAKCRELNRAGKVCKDLGVRLCSHNHGQELEHDARVLRAILGDTDPEQVAIVLDVGNPFPPTFTPSAIVRRYGKRIPVFHLRDSVAGKEVLFGAGECDFAGLGRALAETDWGGWLIVEVNRNPQIPSRKMVESARDFVRKQMKL
jgi:sugar phosphate isomerase/epimerase